MRPYAGKHSLTEPTGFDRDGWTLSEIVRANYIPCEPRPKRGKRLPSKGVTTTRGRIATTSADDTLVMFIVKSKTDPPLTDVSGLIIEQYLQRQGGLPMRSTTQEQTPNRVFRRKSARMTTEAADHGFVAAFYMAPKRRGNDVAISLR